MQCQKSENSNFQFFHCQAYHSSWLIEFVLLERYLVEHLQTGKETDTQAKNSQFVGDQISVKLSNFVLHLN